MSYKKPTLIEIYAEVYLAPSSLKAPQFFDVVPNLKTAGFTEVEVMGGLALDTADQNVKEQTRIRCWSSDRKRLAQVSEDLLVVNLVGTYPGWNAFQEVFESARTALSKSIGKLQLQSINLNTIDRFSVPREGYIFDRLVDCSGKMIPSWYRGSKEPLDITLGRAMLKEDGFNRQVRVQVRRQDEVTVEFRVTLHDSIQNENKAEDVLEKLHDESNEIFESLITDTTRTEIMGGA